MDNERSRVVTLNLPWAPTANSYWRRNGARYFIAPQGIAYRQKVRLEVLTQHRPFSAFIGDVAVNVEAYPPDRRKRDIDNLCKALMDSLTYSGIYLDDYQVIDLHIIRYNVSPPGHLTVTITSI